MQKLYPDFGIEFVRRLCRHFICIALPVCAVLSSPGTGLARHSATVPHTAHSKKALVAAPKKQVRPPAAAKKTAKASKKRPQRVQHTPQMTKNPNYVHQPVQRAPSVSRDSLRSGDDQRLRSELEKYVGIGYKPGGTGNGGFDCSGFARSMYQKLFGLELPHNAQSQYQLPSLSGLREQSLKTGDLVFFSPTARKKRINHVGIYLNDGQFIHAQSGRGIVVSSINDEHWRERLVSGKRIEHTGSLSIRSLDSSWQDPDDDDGSESQPVSTGLHVNIGGRKSGSLPQERYRLKKTSAAAARPRFMELKYIRPVFGRFFNLQLGSFRQDFDPEITGADSDCPTFDRFAEAEGWGSASGIRLAGDIQPFRWMSITPQLLYYRNGRELDSLYMPSRSLGLDLNLSPVHADWSLSTALRYSSLRPSDLRGTSRAADPAQLDLSLTYAHRLSEKTQLSFMGQHLRGSGTVRLYEAAPGSGADERLFFLLKYNY